MTESHRFRFNAMGCPCELVLDEASTRRASRALSLVKTEVMRLEQKYSTWIEDSHWQQILRQAATEPVAVDEETARLLDLAATGYRLSDGLFDISAGPLVRLWDFRKALIPEHSQIEAALAICGWDRVEWQDEQLFLPLPGMHLDLDGLVKEYAADACAGLLSAAGYRRALVNLGGDVACINDDPIATPFEVAIQNPDQADAAIARLSLPAGGLASSGCYQRCFEIDGRRYSHLIHPLIGEPVTGLMAVSVTAPQCTTAGILATTGCLKGTTGRDWLQQTGLPWISIDDTGRLEGHIGLRSD